MIFSPAKSISCPAAPRTAASKCREGAEWGRQEERGRTMLAQIRLRLGRELAGCLLPRRCRSEEGRQGRWQAREKIGI